jgi:hypothetical protein
VYGASSDPRRRQALRAACARGAGEESDRKLSAETLAPVSAKTCLGMAV